jgi:hypothetical protein
MPHHRAQLDLHHRLLLLLLLLMVLLLLASRCCVCCCQQWRYITYGASSFINSSAYQWCGQLRVHEPVETA